MSDQEERPAGNWGAEPWRAPDLQEGDSLLFSECGRVLEGSTPGNATDHRSHYFRMVRAQFGGFFLLVKHGGGQERIKLDWSPRIAQALAALDSDARYYMLHTLHKVAGEAARAARDAEGFRYRAAFAEGRLHKRKIRGQDTVKVWIE